MGFVKKVVTAISGGQKKGESGPALGADVMQTVTGQTTPASQAALAGSPAPAAATAAAATLTPEQTTAAAEEARKRKLLQINGGATQGNVTGSNGVTGNTDTTRKMLLGL